MKYIRDVIYIVVIMILTMLCVHFGLKEPEIKTETIVKTDTVVRVDTFTITKEKIKYKERIKLDTLYLHDTIFIKEQVVFSDSFVSVWVSGYHPEIDSVHYKIPEKTIYVDKIVKETVERQKKWYEDRFIINAGFGVHYGIIHQKFDVGPSLTFGIRIF